MQLTDYCSVNDLKEDISMKMIKKVYNTVFAPPSSIDLAKIELEKSRKAFLEAKTHTEFYASQVEFEITRIKRLEEYVNAVVEIKETTTNSLPDPVAPVRKMVMTHTTLAKKVALRKKVVHSVSKKGLKV